MKAEGLMVYKNWDSRIREHNTFNESGINNFSYFIIQKRRK